MNLILVMSVLAAVDMSIEPWRAVNDNVMGGVSTGGMAETGSGLRFEGQLSLENNGGFASVRRFLSQVPNGSRGFRLTVSGDGRSYEFRLRQHDGFDGIAWRQQFSTDGSIQVIDLPYSDFEPVFRGRRVSGAAPLRPAQLRQIGFLIADKAEGKFALDVLNIELIR